MNKHYIWIAPILFLLATVKETYMAMIFIDGADITTQQAISLWGGEIDIASKYSGAQLGVVKHIDRALYSFLLFGVFTVLSILMYRKK